jgi:integrase
MSIAKAKLQATTSRPSNGTPTSAEKRAFTDAELVALLTAPGVSPLLRDAMLAALLTGTRIEELCSIRAGEVKLTGDVPLIDPQGLKD